ncbi:MAG TPA: hypothetical protein PKZ12_03880, partial [Smithellaceae bacterium]|nr:hypothetical protein [Smithellaceae bacterium]
MRTCSKILALAALLPLMISLQSCLVATDSTIITPEIRSLYEGDYKVDPYMTDNIPKSVAVMPFVDLSDS